MIIATVSGCGLGHAHPILIIAFLRIYLLIQDICFLFTIPHFTQILDGHESSQSVLSATLSRNFARTIISTLGQRTQPHYIRSCRLVNQYRDYLILLSVIQILVSSHISILIYHNQCSPSSVNRLRESHRKEIR